MNTHTQAGVFFNPQTLNSENMNTRTQAVMLFLNPQTLNSENMNTRTQAVVF